MKLKYFIRGVGVALIITAAFFYVFNVLNSSDTENKQLTDDHIITRAKELGMTFENDEANIRNDSDIVEEDNDAAINLSDEEIIQLAEALGMSFLKEEPIEDTSPEANDSEEPEANTDNQPSLEEDAHDDTKQPEEEVPEYATVRIAYGLDSEKIAYLFQKEGIIEDAKDFNAYIIKNKYDRKLQPGTYKLIKGSSYEEILEKITK